MGAMGVLAPAGLVLPYRPGFSFYGDVGAILPEKVVVCQTTLARREEKQENSDGQPLDHERRSMPTVRQLEQHPQQEDA